MIKRCRADDMAHPGLAMPALSRAAQGCSQRAWLLEQPGLHSVWQRTAPQKGRLVIGETLLHLLECGWESAEAARARAQGCLQTHAAQVSMIAALVSPY